nr:uncharacterized protein LOC132770211 [Anolis sagrei ordinatus]
MMPSKKNVGGSKGKGPAKRAPAKRPPPTEDACEGEEAISLEALSGFRALLAAVQRGAPPAARAKTASASNQEDILNAILSRLSAVESVVQQVAAVASHSRAEEPQVTPGAAQAEQQMTEQVVSAQPVGGTEVNPVPQQSAVSMVNPGTLSQVSTEMPTTSQQEGGGSAGSKDTTVYPWGSVTAQANGAQGSTEMAPPTTKLQAVEAEAIEAQLSSNKEKQLGNKQFWGTPEWPQKADPDSDILQIDSHLSPKTIEKIRNAEYVDMFSLLYRDLDKKQIEELGEDQRGKFKKRKVEESWTNWFNGYLIYMSVVMEAYPSRGRSLVHYLNIIHSAQVDYTGNAWLEYDRRFRALAALKPTLRWDRIHGHTWLQVMTAAKTIQGEKTDNGHSIRNSRGVQPFRQLLPQQQQQQKKAACWEFSAQGAWTDNTLADALSRMQIKRFRQLAPNADLRQEKLPDHLWQIGTRS